jgi:hypothetical protein
VNSRCRRSSNSISLLHLSSLAGVRDARAATDSLKTKGVQMIENTIQIGDPVAHRAS